MQIAVLGAGSWGSALAIALSHVADNVLLWSHKSQQIDYLQTHHNNPSYLPAEITFPANVCFTANLNECRSADLLIIATPLNAVREILQHLKQSSDPIADIFLVSKGFEANTGLLPHQIVAQELVGFKRYGLLIGPSFAKEVALGLPTAITLVAPKLEFAVSWMNKLQDIPNFRIYAHDDVVGSEVGSAVKNVLAIAVGIADGLSLGYNARAALITRSLNELASLVLALGGRRETIYGLTGIGDLILTCTGDLSRNRKVGQELALGKSINDIVTSLGHVAEGVSTAREIYLKAQALGIDMPIVECVYRIIYQQANIQQEVSQLLTRQPKSEFISDKK
jgi:glycerol-3-phosphate dehydrogenase (NAD(P)+)